MRKNITSKVKCNLNDGEFLPLTRCVCGEEFENWDFLLNMESDSAKECPKCNRKMFFTVDIKVFEVVEEKR